MGSQVVSCRHASASYPEPFQGATTAARVAVGAPTQFANERMRDTLLDLALLILVGLAAGFLSATILGERRRYSIFGYLVVGSIGALGGNFAFTAMQFPIARLELRLLAAIAGATVLVALLRLLRR